MSTIRIQALPKFPASVEAGDGIVIERSGGVFTFSFDPSVFTGATLDSPTITGALTHTGPSFSLQNGVFATGEAPAGLATLQMVATGDYNDNVLVVANVTVDPLNALRGGNAALVFSPEGGAAGAFGNSPRRSVRPQSYYPNTLYAETLTPTGYPDDDIDFAVIHTHQATARFPHTTYRNLLLEGASGNVSLRSSPNLGNNDERIGLTWTASTHQLAVLSTDAGANAITFKGETGAGGASIAAGGTNSAVLLRVFGKGGGGVALGDNGAYSLFATSPASAVNYLTASGSVAASPLAIGAIGADTNIDINITPKGGGQTFTPTLGITGTAGAGFLGLAAQSGANPATPGSGSRLFASSAGHFAWRTAADGFIRSFAGNLTADRVLSFPDASGTIALTAGATIPAIATGDLLYGSATNTLSALADVATGNALISGGAGAAPSWGKIGISTHVNGLGTGVAAALGANVGSAGAVVVNGGALGSPSSAGTLPAHTLGGTVSGGGNQINNVIIGTVTPLAGAFTTLTATTSATVGTGSGSPSFTVFGSGSNGAGPFFTFNRGGANDIAIGTAGGILGGAAANADFLLYSGSGGDTRFYLGGAEKARFTNAGGFSVGTTSDPGAGSLRVNAHYDVGTNQVVGARDTGWTAMTGTANKATAYDTASVTLAQLAGRVMSLQAALTSHGLIGA